MKQFVILLLILLAAVLLSGCGAPSEPPPSDTTPDLPRDVPDGNDDLNIDDVFADGDIKPPTTPS